MDLLFTEDELDRKGSALSLHLSCENCGWKHSFYTSKQQGKSFEANRRLVYSMRTLGNRTKLYKHGPGLPVELIAKLKPEYARLSDDSLFKKCLHGKTQNQNEALNGMI